MAEINYYDTFQDKMRDMGDLFTRMEDDNKLITGFDYIMKSAANKKIDDVITLSTNRPAVFDAYVEAALNKADEKVYVESEDEKIDTATIEDIVRSLFAQANEKRRKAGLYNLEPYWDQQNCRRGRCMSRIITQPKTDKDGNDYLDIDITPWDTKYACCEIGSDGLSWGGYEMKKTKGMIESEAWALEAGYTIAEKDAKEVEIWTPEENIIYINGEEAYRQAHTYGFTPIVYTVVPIGSMLSDSDNLRYEGESIFFLIRHLIPEFNRLVSILQTNNMFSVKPPMQQVVEAGGEASEYEDISSMGSNTPVTTPGAIQPIPFPEIRRAAIMMMEEISRELDDGTLSRIMLGELPGEMSAVALVQIEQGQGQVYMPRLGTRGLHKESLSDMAISQIQTLGVGSFELGTRGHKRPFKVGKLDGEYEITFNYANKNPETDFARISLAERYKDVLDEETILADVIKRDDPEGDLARVRRQRLRQLSPTLQIYDGLMALSKLYEEGDDSLAAEIEIVEAELGVNLEQIASGAIPQYPGKKDEKMPTTPLLPLTSNKRASDLQRTPGMEIEEE